MNAIHTKVSDLPPVIAKTLKAYGHRSHEVAIRAAETFTPAGSSGQGMRRVIVLLNMATGDTETRLGSWGGPNMFNPGNAVDMDRNAYPIPPGVVVLEGCEGSSRGFSVIVRPDMIAPMLPVAVDLTEREVYLLGAYRSLTSAGRKNEFERTGKPPTADELAGLVSRGFLAKAGSGLKITADGKNAVGNKGRF